MIHVLTPLMREENIDTLTNHLRPFGVIWHPICDYEVNFLEEDWIKPMVAPVPSEWSLNGSAPYWKLNQFNDYEDGDYYCVLGDDDLYADNFFDEVRNRGSQVIMVHMTPDGVDLLPKPENMRVTRVGMQQSLIQGWIRKNYKYTNSHTADGEMIEQIYKEHPEYFTYVPEAFVKYNALLKPAELTVIVPVYNHLHETKQMCESLMQETKNFTLIMVDDGCTDDTPKYVEELKGRLGEKFIYIKNPENLGVNAAWNVGLRKAMELRPRYICIANNDIIFAPNWSEPLMRALDTGYALVSPTSTEQVVPADWPAGRNRHTNPVGIEMLGACFMFKKPLIHELGLFPEEMRHYFGDNWIMDMAKKRGHKVGHIQASYIHHFFCVTSSQLDNNHWFKVDGAAYLEYCKLPEPKPKQS